MFSPWLGITTGTQSGTGVAWLRPEDMLPTAEDGELTGNDSQSRTATGWVQECSMGVLKHGSGQYPVLVLRNHHRRNTEGTKPWADCALGVKSSLVIVSF